MICHARRWTGTRFTATACGAPSFVDYGTTNPANVSCSACLALLEPVIAPEPVMRAEPVTKKRKANEPKPQTGFEF